MGYTYTPTYYSSLQDSITSICKSILPFSFKKPRLPPSEQKLSKQQTENLKWQQNSYHKILNLMGLQKEGIVSENDVGAFRTQLLETLIAAKGAEYEQPPVLRDKLIFLQELLYAKCITPAEYHASKRPLIQRLAAQGAEIEARDVIVGTEKDETHEGKDDEEEQWSVIDLRDEQTLLGNKENSSTKTKSKHVTSSAIKHIKDAASVFGLGSSQKQPKTNKNRSIFESSKDENVGFGENPFCNNSQTILMSQCPGPSCESNDNGKNKNKKRKQWGLMRWKGRSNVEEDETARLESSFKLVSSPGGEDVGTKEFIIKRKVLCDGNPSSGFFIDKVLSENIKKELSRIQSELSSTNPNFEFSNDQMDVISTKLPVDKAELNQFFPKSWCDRYGDVVIEVVKKEFKEHVGEMENTRNATLERRQNHSKRWTTFGHDHEDDENTNPNSSDHLFGAPQKQTLPLKQKGLFTSSENPFAAANGTSSYMLS